MKMKATVELPKREPTFLFEDHASKLIRSYEDEAKCPTFGAPQPVSPKQRIRRGLVLKSPRMKQEKQSLQNRTFDSKRDVLPPVQTSTPIMFERKNSPAYKKYEGNINVINMAASCGRWGASPMRSREYNSKYGSKYSQPQSRKFSTKNQIQSDVDVFRAGPREKQLYQNFSDIKDALLDEAIQFKRIQSQQNKDEYQMLQKKVRSCRSNSPRSLIFMKNRLNTSEKQQQKRELNLSVMPCPPLRKMKKEDVIALRKRKKERVVTLESGTNTYSIAGLLDDPLT